MYQSSSPVYGAGHAPYTPNRFSTNDTNMVQAALEEKARDEACANDPRFAEFCACQRIDMSDVSVVIAETIKETTDGYMNAIKAAHRIVADWITYRVGTMSQWEREEVANKTLRLVL